MLNYITLANLVLSFDHCSNKKLQKLCYYLYAWYLTVYNKKVSDVNFEAWVHGPVCPEIYNKYKVYGWYNIPKFEGVLFISEEIYNFSNKIINYYSKYNADELEELSHKEAPWLCARHDLKPYENSNETISDEEIIKYYSKLHLYKQFKN